MQRYKKRYCFSTAEYYFTQRLCELTYYGTLDSYRVRLNNPKTTIEELCQVLLDWHSKKIKDFKTVEAVINELKKLLKNESELSFLKTSKNSFLKILNDCNKEEYIQLLYASRTILTENESYSTVLFEKLGNEIKRLNSITPFGVEEYDTTERLLGYLISELCSWGYSKSFLFHLARSLFSKPSTHTFDNSLKMFSKVVENKSPETFSVFLKAKFSNIELELLRKRIPELLSPEIIDEYKSTAPKEFLSFYSESSKEYPDIFHIKVESLDYYDAVKLARARVSEILDIVKLGYTERSLKIFKTALLISNNDPTKIEKQRIFYQIDGRVETSPEIYDRFLIKFLSIRENQIIAHETKEKIKSAIRYFRLGTESIEIEQKFINYWIGIEYLFSNYDVSSSTFHRFKNYFTKIHSLTYFKRNLIEFHNDLLQGDVISQLPTFKSLTDINYLLEPATFDFIRNNYKETEPLLSYRANTFYEILTNDKSFKNYILNHIDNLEGHLIRIYRIRNEIVHEAAIKPNIENLTANLRYYLIFAITSLLDFFYNPPNELNINGRISIDDYFIFKSLDFENFKNNKDNQKSLFDNEYSENIIY